MPEVTLMTAGLVGLLMIVLGLRVSAVRRSAGVSLGDGGNPLLEARIRAHANCVETAPIALILLGLVEGVHGASWFVWALAGVLLLCRVLHPIGMERPAPNAPRVLGMLGTWGATGVLALMALAAGAGQLSACEACARLG